MESSGQASVFCSVEEALDIIRAGRMLLVVDDESRENEGDLVAAGESVTPEIINFMATHGRGLICERDRFRTAFTISVDARDGISTGISAFDRARTVQKLADDRATACDFIRPGHMFPLQAVPGGVLRRTGHTEASIDLAKLAGLKPVAVDQFLRTKYDRVPEPPPRGPKGADRLTILSGPDATGA